MEKRKYLGLLMIGVMLIGLSGCVEKEKQADSTEAKLMKDLNYGKGYEKYSQESYLPEDLKGKNYLKKKI